MAATAKYLEHRRMAFLPAMKIRTVAMVLFRRTGGAEVSTAAQIYTLRSSADDDAKSIHFGELHE
jgi:hypothetical protein